MDNSGETRTMSRLTVEMGSDKYVLSGGGGLTPGVPIPADTVDSAAIQPGAVEMEDLNDEVKDRMITDDDRVTQEDLDNFQI